MKKEWERKTVQCDYTQIRPELRAAIEKELKELDEELDIQFCISTESTQLKKGLFGGKQQVQQSACIVTPKWLVQAVDLGDGKTGPVAVFHYLSKMQVSSDTMEMAQKLGIEDYGIDVFGQTRWNLKGSSYFIGMQQSGVSEQFINTLKEAIRKAG